MSKYCHVRCGVIIMDGSLLKQGCCLEGRKIGPWTLNHPFHPAVIFFWRTLWSPWARSTAQMWKHKGLEKNCGNINGWYYKRGQTYLLFFFFFFTFFLLFIFTGSDIIANSAWTELPAEVWNLAMHCCLENSTLKTEALCQWITWEFWNLDD